MSAIIGKSMNGICFEIYKVHWAERNTLPTWICYTVFVIFFFCISCWF